MVFCGVIANIVLFGVMFILASAHFVTSVIELPHRVTIDPIVLPDIRSGMVDEASRDKESIERFLFPPTSV